MYTLAHVYMHTHTPVIKPRHTNSTGNTLHFFMMVTLGSGTNLQAYAEKDLSGKERECQNLYNTRSVSKCPSCLKPRSATVEPHM